MKNMRAVFMDQDPVVIIKIVCVAADVVSNVANEDPFTESIRQTLGQYTAGKTSSNYQIIKHFLYPLLQKIAAVKIRRPRAINLVPIRRDRRFLHSAADRQ